MPTVLRVLTRLNIGGPSRQALLLHRVLPVRGYRSILAAGSSEGAEGNLNAWEKADVVRIPGLRRGASGLEAAAAAFHLCRLIADVKPDIVHTHMAMAGFIGRTAGWISAPGARYVHTFHGHVFDGYFAPWKAHLYQRIEALLGRHTDALVAISKRAQGDLLRRGIGDLSKWHTIPLGLELEELLAVPPRCSGAGRVGIVGRLVPIKDHRTLLAAMTEVPGARLIVAGDGELRRELEGVARDLGLGDRVEFRGWVRDLPRLYAELDVVVLSSSSEGTPAALIEAQAAARPTVATDVGAVADVVVHNRTGLLVKSGDAIGMAVAIRRLLDSPESAVAMGREGRRYVAERYSAKRLVDDVDRLYRSLLAA